MVRGADDPEDDDTPTADTESTAAIKASTFPPELIAHMVRCWDAERENAERLAKKVNVIVSVLALLFGLGLFKIEWTYDPDHLSRVDSVATIWLIKICLTGSLLLFAIGLYLGISPTRQLKRQEEGDAIFASTLLQFPEEILESPPANDVEARAVVYYRLSEAIDDLNSQNYAKNLKVRSCSQFFMWGLLLVFIAVSAYILCGIPPIRGSRDHGQPDTKPSQRRIAPTNSIPERVRSSLCSRNSRDAHLDSGQDH